MIQVGGVMTAAALLWPSPHMALEAQQSVVTGVVTDASGVQPVAAADVFIAGTPLIVVTDANGLYRLTNVPSGAVELRVERLGYVPQSRLVQATPGATVTVDFQLEVSAIALDAVVATATGPQRRRELGNATATVQAARELETTTPGTLTDLLQGRAAGVQVVQSSGTVGSSATIKIRGNSSISLDNTPLIYVDGSRISNDIRSGPGVGGQNTSRLNDLNPNDIDAIEIVKGPSAATLYGTEAAAGVIRITTRRGRTGLSEWTYRSSLGANWDATDWPSNAVSLRSPFLLGPPARDTVYTLNLLEGVGTDQDPWRTGLEQSYGAALRGGVEGVTYFVSGDLSDREGSLSNNESQQRTLRANLNLAPSDDVDVAVSTGFGSTDLSLPNNDNTTLGFLGVALNAFAWELPLVRDDPVTGAPGVETCAIDYEGSLAFGVPLGTIGCAGEAFFSGRTFEDVATVSSTQKIERFTGSVAVDYRPSESVRARGTVGYDQFSDQTGTFIPVDPTLVFDNLSLGFRQIQNFVSRNLTLEGNLAGTFELSPTLTSTTTVGGQFFAEKLESAASLGRTLPAGTSTVSNAVTTEGFESVTETRTLGIFLEQQIAYRDRLFLTPAVRVDENSAFGRNLGRQAYPRVMASYVISEEMWFPTDLLQSLRLRVAWGESGKQPASFAALQLLEAQRVTFRGQDVAGVVVQRAGNPDLEPERGQELEVGFEADLMDGRVAVDFTWYDQLTRDAIVARRLAPSTGFPDRTFQNIGRIRHTGVELGITWVGVNRPDLFWTWQLVGGTSKGKITQLEEPIVYGLNGDTQRHQKGHPFGAYFSRKYTIGTDGSPEATDEPVFLGHPTPEWEGSLSTSIRLFNRLTLYANLGFAGGHHLFNSTEEFRCGFLGGGPNGGICPAIYEEGPDGEPTNQARIKAAAAADNQYSPWIEDADFARLRMVGARFDLPMGWVTRLGASRGDFTLTAENLALWTAYSGVDPEVNFAGADPSTRADFLTLPPSRRITGRLSITF